VELIVDGYNALRGAPEWRFKEGTSLAEERSGLERRLARYGARHPEVRVILYWDGDPDLGAPAPRRVQGISVVFARPSADGAILDRVRAAGNRAQTRVVTDDRALAEAVENLGARVVRVDDLARWLIEVQDTGDRPEKPKPDRGVGKDITDDLKDVWGV
jgi:predicted RNA-binding protein with PIN domain